MVRFSQAPEYATTGQNITICELILRMMLQAAAASWFSRITSRLPGYCQVMPSHE